MVGFSHAINNLKPSRNIKQEELLPDPDLSIPLVNSSIPDFDFIDEWLKETDSMDTEVPLHINETANGGKPVEEKTEQTELLSSRDIPLVQETGVDSSIEIALEKVSLVGTSEGSGIVDVKSEAVVTSGSGDCWLEKNLMASEGGGDDVSLVNDDPTKSQKHVDEGDKESSEIVKDNKDDDDDSSESESDDEEDESEDESSSSSESSDEEDEEEEEEKMGDVEEGEIKELEELIGESDGDEEVFLVKGPIKSKNEVQDLPPVPKVDVTLEPHHQTLLVGVVLTIMDAKVIVEGVEL